MTTTITQRRRLTALRAAWLFDGTSSTLTANPVVMLDGGNILAVDGDPLTDPAALQRICAVFVHGAAVPT